MRRNVDRVAALPREVFLVVGVVSALGVATVADTANAQIWATLAMLIGFGYGGMGAIIRGRRLSGRRQLAWTLIGLGLTTGALGLIVFGVLDSVGVDLPTFGPLDLFFLTAYGLLLSGLVLLPHSGGNLRQRVVIWMDGLVGAVSIATLSWVWVLSDAFGSLGDQHGWARFVGIAYPVFDVMLVIAATMMVLRRTSLRFDIRLAVVALGLLFQGLADLVLLTYTSAGGALADAHAAFPFFAASAVCLALMGALVDREPKTREYAFQKPPWWSLISPYATASLMVAVFLSELNELSTSRADRLMLLALASTAVAVATIGRQAVAIVDNRTRVEAERREMVSSLSHEMRTPLTSVVGFVDLIRQGDVVGEERDELLELVGDELEYLSRIVCDLVLLARENPSAMKLDRGQVDVWSIIQESISHPGADAGAVSMTRVQDDLIADVDPNRLKQLMANLTTNATRYGGGRIDVVAEARGLDLVLEVHDDGPGVPPRFQVVIWDRFERGAHRFDAVIPGSGIGLAIVKAIAQAHGGTTGYRMSERLGGACFSVRIPGVVAAWRAGLPNRSLAQAPPDLPRRSPART